MEDAVDARDGLHQRMAAHRFIQVHGVRRRDVEAGQPHVAHDNQLERVVGILEAFLDFQAHGGAAIRAGSLDDGVLLQHGGDAHGVPDIVAEIGLLPCPDEERGRHGREGIRHQHFARLFLQDKHVRLGQPLERGLDFLRRAFERGSGLRQAGRQAIPHRVIVDEGAHFLV